MRQLESPPPQHVLLVLCIVALLLSSVVSIIADDPSAPETGVLNEELQREWQGYEDDTQLRVIIQFVSPMTGEDWSLLSSLDFEETWRYQVIHGAAGYLTAAAIAELSHYHRTWWIEKDTLNEYALDVSTGTIRADSTWERIVLDNNGDPWRENDVELPVDGSGVTIVVADTGIDATHPDLDYQEKVIENKKADVDGQPWVELPNTDNLFGHGTHCAGIAAGTGEASAGARRGVAPGASLIGLGIGDPWETNEVGAFDWVYEHSAPPNPYNIRVITNSWGYESVDENWKDAVLQASQRLTYERNVVVTFAASNDGGDGSESRTNIYGNSPGMISVAASYREGGGIAGFSSRGDRTDNATWPDIAAPGVEIWAARDSTGFIVNAVAGDTNPYYTAISGTSMATPHVAGVAALLWQAAPSLTFSDMVDDSTSYDDAYLNDEWSYIHELELILKLTGDYIEPDGGNGVPNEKEKGVVGRDHDFAQGYGQVNVEQAVALALTLEELRRTEPQTTVWEALDHYQDILTGGLATKNVNGARQQVQMFQENNLRSESSWFGEYITGPGVSYGQEHELFVPEQARLLVADFFYDQMDLDDLQFGELDLFVEAGGSGAQRLTLPDLLTPDGHKRVEFPTDTPPLSNLPRDEVWTFSVSGLTTRVEYLVELSLVMDGPVTLSDPTMRPEQVEVDLPGYGSRHQIRAATKYFDLGNVLNPPPTGPTHTLTIEALDGDAEVSVYRAGNGDVALAAGNSPLEVDLHEDWYYARASKPGYWPASSADFLLTKDTRVVLPSLVERDLELPEGKFRQPQSGTKVEGTVKVKFELFDDIGLSSITVTAGGQPVFAQELNGVQEKDLSFSWDTTRHSDGEMTLRGLLVDTDGNDHTFLARVEVDNEEDSKWKYLVILLAAIGLVGLGAWMSGNHGRDRALSQAPPEERAPLGYQASSPSFASSGQDPPLEAEQDLLSQEEDGSTPLEAETLKDEQ